MTPPRRRFLANLIRVGLVLGFWCGIAVSLSGSIPFAVLTGAFITAITAGFVTYDVYLTRSSHPDRSTEDV